MLPAIRAAIRERLPRPRTMLAMEGHFSLPEIARFVARNPSCASTYELEYALESTFEEGVHYVPRALEVLMSREAGYGERVMDCVVLFLAFRGRHTQLRSAVECHVS